MSLGWPGDMEPMDVHFTKGQKKFLADLQEKRHLEECAAAREHQGCGVVTDEMVEAGAIALCHFDGIDYCYGNHNANCLYEWPTGIESSDGSEWENDDEAKEHYRDVAEWVLRAAFRVKGER